MKEEISFFCENDKASKNISFLQFEKEYLKDINSLNYEKNNLNNLPKYIYDEKIKNYNNILKYFYENEKCLNHNYIISEYCEECKANICIFCFSEKQHREDHLEKITKYRDIIPSINEYNNINTLLNKREEFINSLILKIENWKKQMIKKVENLKKILTNEISFLKKFILNFNRKYLNYCYINNFNNIYKYLKENDQAIYDTNIQKMENVNKNIYLFYKSDNFSNQTSILNDIFSNLEINNKFEIFFNYSNEYQDFVYLNDYYLVAQKNDNEIHIVYPFKNEIKTVTKIKLDGGFNDYIMFINVSKFDNKIIVIFNQGKIFILNYILNENKIFIKEEIKEKAIYCVEIKKDYLLFYNNNNFYLWKDMKKDIKKSCPYKISHICPVNSEFFLVHDNEKNIIYFYDVNTLRELKKINNIYSLINISTFRNKYITFLGKNMIYLINIKTQELVQIIKYDNYHYRYYVNNNNIYLIYENTMNHFHYISENNEFILIKKEYNNSGYDNNLFESKIFFTYLVLENF